MSLRMGRAAPGHSCGLPKGEGFPLWELQPALLGSSRVDNYRVCRPRCVAGVALRVHRAYTKE